MCKIKNIQLILLSCPAAPYMKSRIFYLLDQNNANNTQKVIKNVLPYGKRRIDTNSQIE